MGEFQTVNMTAYCDGLKWLHFTAQDPFTLSFPDLAKTRLQSIRLFTCEDVPCVIVYAWVLY